MPCFIDSFSNYYFVKYAQNLMNFGFQTIFRLNTQKNANIHNNPKSLINVYINEYDTESMPETSHQFRQLIPVIIKQLSSKSNNHQKA